MSASQTVSEEHVRSDVPVGACDSNSQLMLHVLIALHTGGPAVAMIFLAASALTGSFKNRGTFDLFCYVLCERDEGGPATEAQVDCYSGL